MSNIKEESVEKIIRFSHDDDDITVTLILQYRDERLESWRVNPGHNNCGHDGHFTFPSTSPRLLAQIGNLMCEVALYIQKILDAQPEIKVDEEL